MPLTTLEKAEIKKIKEDVGTLRFFLVGNVDETTGQPTNGLIRKVEKIVANQAVITAQIAVGDAYRGRTARIMYIGFGVIGLLDAAQLWRLNGTEITAIFNAIEKVWPK